jgi:hypothetical protein
MTKRWITGLLASAAAWAQPAMAPPQVGFVEDGARSLRPAYGLAGNFILGPAVAGSIVSEAFGGSFGLLKTDSSLSTFDSRGKLIASIDTAPGPALFAFSADGVTALAYIVAAKALVEWNGSSFVPVSIDNDAIEDIVLAIALPATEEAALVVQRKDVVWKLSRSSQTTLLGVHAPLLVLPSGDIVYVCANGIIVRRTDASEVHIAASLPVRFSLQQMNRDWVQLTDLQGSARFAIRTTPGRESFYRLPE